MAHPAPAPVRPAPPKAKFSSSMRGYIIGGIVACVVLVFGFGGWAATAELASAVISAGKVVVASNVKSVQHSEGGIVGEIMVSDGDTVQAGDLLLQLDETLVAANRALLDGQIIAMEARLARLQAERNQDATIQIPEELADRTHEVLVKRAIDSEQKVFQARKETISGQTDRLNERTKQLQQQITGLKAQQQAKEEEIALIEEELEVLGDLYDRGRTTRDKIVNLKRTRTRLEGERGDLISQIAVAEGRISETELEILQLTIDQREKTFAEITEIEPELANLKERRIAADFQLSHMDIRAPSDGTVFELAVHTVGGVVQPAETIMQIVPQAEKLVIESRIAPVDVDQVHIGQEASLVLSAFDYKTTPRLHGHVTFVAAEASLDEQTGVTYYVVRVALDDGELERLPEDVTLMPGMPAEVYISTGGHTVIEYLVKPLSQQIRRVWRET